MCSTPVSGLSSSRISNLASTMYRTPYKGAGNCEVCHKEFDLGNSLKRHRKTCQAKMQTKRRKLFSSTPKKDLFAELSSSSSEEEEGKLNRLYVNVNKSLS